MQKLSKNDPEGHFISSLVKDRYFKVSKRTNIDYSKYLVGASYGKLLKAKKLSSITIKNYGWYVYHFCKSINLTTEDIVAKYSLPGQYSYDFQKLVETYILGLNNEVDAGLKPQKVAGACSALQKFSRLNQITIDWEYINQFVPTVDNNAKDEAYSREQIKDFLECGIDLRLKVAVLFMASGGLRREAMVGLENRDVHPIYSEDKLIAAKVEVYSGEMEHYTTFVTPEAYQTYQRYLNARIRYGEPVTENSPVIIKRFDVSKDKKAKIDNRPISASTLDGLLIAAAIKAGVRSPSPYYKNMYRNKACHAFRKFFETTLLNVKKPNGDRLVDPYSAVKLMGNSVKQRLGLGVIRNYDRSDYQQLLHEYKKAAWDLTINDEERLRVENLKLKDDLRVISSVTTDMTAMKNQLQIITSSLASMDQPTRNRLAKEWYKSGLYTRE